MNEYRIHTFGLNSFIDVFISSFYVKVRKPDKAIYKMALDMAKVAPYEVIYIDDVQMFTDIATGIGIKSILHTDTLSTCKTLAALDFQTDQMKLIDA